MKKVRNRRGFTLIEMMAVVAIVAVLVSIITPIFGESKNKANAATNAANLRTVESQLAQLLVTNPGAFEKETDEQFIEDMVGVINTAIDEVLYPILSGAELLLEEMKTPTVIYIPFVGQVTIPAASEEEIEKQQNRVNGWKQTIKDTEEVRDRKVYLYQHSYTAVDGIITLDDGTQISAPTSKSMNVDDMTIEEGIEMMIVVSDNEIIAYYNGLSRDVFALVADDGSSANISGTKHDYYDNDNDGTCDVCGNNENHNKYEYGG